MALSTPIPNELSYKQISITLGVPILIGCYLVLTSTTNLFPQIPAWDIKRIGQILLLSAITLIALINQDLRQAYIAQFSRTPRSIAWALILFFSLGLTSAIVNFESSRGLLYSLIDVFTLALLIILIFIIAACRFMARERFDRTAISLLTLLGLAAGVQELAGFWAGWMSGFSYSFDIALLHFSHPRMYNHLQTWSIPLVAVLPLFFPKSRLALSICLITLGLHWYILLVTGARGSAVSLLVAFVIAGLFSSTARILILKFHLTGILLGVTLYFTLLFAGAGLEERHGMDPAAMPGDKENVAVSDNHRNPSPKLPVNQNSNNFYDLSLGRPMLHTTGRSNLWRSAYRDAIRKPILGIGPMNFACKGPVGRVGSPHNLPLQILSEWGFPAFFIIAVLGLSLLRFLVGGLINRVEDNHPGHVLRTSLIIAALAAGVHLMVSSLLIAPASQIMGALIGGWLLGTSPASRNIARPSSAMTCLAAGVLWCVLLIPFAFHETVKMPGYREQLPKVESGRPRFWQLGKACSNGVN